VIGNGAIPSAGATVKITYTGLLPDGTVFDSRMKRLSPFVFRKGVNQVVKGLDLGMEGMKVGGSREISIPPELG
jgi:FKBP-type peptidyl-prolyl cis-trans isomerase